HERGTAARVPGQVLHGLQVEFDVGGTGDHAGGLDRVGPGVVTALTPGTLVLDLAGGHGGHVQRLVREGIDELGDLGVGGLPGHGRHRRAVRTGERDLLEAEEGDVVTPAGDVA